MNIVIFRYSDPDPDLQSFRHPCNHNSKSYKCSLVTKADVVRARKKFYDEPVKTVQDQKLCHLISVSEPKRRRAAGDIEDGKRKTKAVQAQYYFRVKGKDRVHPVCRPFLLAALGITKNRVIPILKTINEGNIPKERRGGNRFLDKSLPVKEEIRKFLNGLPASESHYSRNKSCRVYLSSDLNIAALCKTYNSTNPEFKTSLSMFKRIFYTEFNIGFSSPASDVCGTCLNLRNSIKQKNGEDKEALIAKLKVHKVRANSFYKLLKESPPGSLSFCFDLQQVHPLPKTPIQDAFYLRQISFYNFCCVDINSRNPVFYTWTENQAGRGSTEIGSALVAHLRSLNLNSVRSLRLFCDGCGGQNKNSHIIHILAFWLRNEAPASVTEIILHFPVRGHSYLPADRVFGRAEKILKTHNIIANPEEYRGYYGQVGRVRSLGTDWELYNIKGLSETYNKVNGIKDLKRIFLKKFSSKKNGATVKVKGSPFFKYENEEAFTSIVKRGRSEKNCSLKPLPLGNPIPLEKKKNVTSLLEKQFNNADAKVVWQDLPKLSFFKDLLLDEATPSQVEEEREDEGTCDCLEEDHAIHV